MFRNKYYKMFCPISGFPNYIISNEGVILNKFGKELKHNIHKDGYHLICLQNKKRTEVMIHRLVYQHFGKNWNPEMTVDHCNGKRGDNHIENLRMATKQQQQFNQSVQKNNKLGIKRVRKCGNKYRSTISINNKEVHLGMFDNAEEASQAYQTKAKELHGEFYRE